jgi:hypothetical protein
VKDPGISTLEPRLVWDRFLELTRIPRPPKHEEEVRAYVLDWAGERGLDSAVDEAGNAVVRVPASQGRARAPTVVLQAHLDMVCERDPDSPNDPREGRIEVVRDGDWVAASGTTLGADNGIGVAGALAVEEDPAIEHGPLELLFTVSEEQGLAGAKELDPVLVSTTPGSIGLNATTPVGRTATRSSARDVVASSATASALARSTASEIRGSRPETSSRTCASANSPASRNAASAPAGSATSARAARGIAFLLTPPSKLASRSEVAAFAVARTCPSALTAFTRPRAMSPPE